MPFIVGEKVSEVLTRLPEQRSSAYPAANFLSNLTRENNNPGDGMGRDVVGLFLTLITLDLLSRRRWRPPTYPPWTCSSTLSSLRLQQLALGVLFLFFFFLMFLLRDWLYFYALDWSWWKERREAKCSSGSFRLFARCSGRSGAAPRQSSAKPTEGKATKTFCTVMFHLWLSGHGAQRAGGNWGRRLVLGETTGGTERLRCLPQPAKGNKSVSAAFSTPWFLLKAKFLQQLRFLQRKIPNLYR